jgi:tRNA dimethylallyltransferase
LAKNIQKTLIILGGATASGKTDLAIRLAQHFETEIVSADSRQFFREMNIGTAKPTTAELAAAPHHFVNNLSVTDAYSVGDFEREALAVLENIFDRHDTAICVGGTGLYLRALCEGLDDLPKVDEKIKQDLQQQFEQEGIEVLQKMLENVDNEFFKHAEIQNPMRLLRALGVSLTTGKPFSSFRTGEKKIRFFKPVYLKTNVERAVLYERINSRVDAMLAAGLVEEVKSLSRFWHLNALRTVGYQEFFDYFEGKIPLAEAVDLVKQHSRNYAKRQETWFRKPISENQQYTGFAPDRFDDILDFLKRQ